MRFPYTRYTVLGTSPNTTALLFRPMVTVRVIGPGGDRDVLARVDSGADDTVLPGDIAGALGLPGLADPATVVGIAGVTLVRYGTVDLEINDGQTAYRWAAYVGFYTLSLHQGPPVLGMNGFLRFFRATFDGRRRHLDLVPNGLAAPPTFPIP